MVYQRTVHPWHGITPFADDASTPDCVHVVVETIPFDVMKYEIDKETGLLRLDRPQKASSLPPYAYGFIPRTLCGPEVAALSTVDKADGDPLDVFVLSEQPIQHTRVLVNARVLGGMAMIDGGEADDKIIVAVDSDPYFSSVKSIVDLPQSVLNKLRHYLRYYKPDTEVEVQAPYDAAQAHRVIQAAISDYQSAFGSSTDT